MKICKTCQKQYSDDVAFCTVCGQPTEVYVEPAVVTPVEVAPQPVQVAPVAQPQQTESKLPVLFGFIGKLSAIFSAFFALAAVACAYIDVDVNVGSYSIYGHADLEAAPFASAMALLFSLATTGFGVFAFIQCLIKHQGLKALFSAITKMATGMLLFILSIILLSTAA